MAAIQNLKKHADSFFQTIGVLSQETKTLPIKDVTNPPLHALIIGIDDYVDDKVPNLQGAEQDAQSFRDYLINDVFVPQAQIKTLLSKDATRANIIDGFKALAIHPNIKKQDPIVIFYAGHGTKLKKPEGWEAGEDHIQALVPQDVKQKDASGNIILPLPDRTIATLLNDIASTNDKGDNIASLVDADLRYAGIKLVAHVDSRYPRFVNPTDLPPIPADIDQNILPKKSEARHAAIAKGFAYQELRSHVLLAACGSSELAYETDGVGDFTGALIKTLKLYGADKTTYKGCIQRLPALPNQNPHCEGFHKERIFFNAQAGGSNRQLILIEKKGDTCTLRAGIAQNITVGAKFKVFERDTSDPAKDTPLGSLRVLHADPTSSKLIWEDDSKPFDLPDISYGFQTHCGSDQFLQVHFTPRLQSRLSVDDAWHSAFTASRTNIVIKPTDLSHADVVVDLDQNNRAVFDIKNKLVNRHGVKELPQSVPVNAEDILAVLRAAALWTWHLNRTNPESSLEQSIRIEFTRVTRNLRTRQLEPTGENLNQSGLVDIFANRNDLYGMKIINESSYNLYPYLFYFDVNGQSIEKWNDQVVGKTHSDAPLRKNSTLTVGYGAGGAIPFAFEVDNNKELELGMLKLYVTNLQGEFSSIEHLSPFTFDEEGKRANVKSTDVAKSLAMRGVWHTVTVALIQRRP